MSENANLQIIKPRVKGFICTTAHPRGLEVSVLNQISYAKDKMRSDERFKNVLVIGSSSGYGLASRIALAFGSSAKTIGLYFERPPRGKRTGSPGWYTAHAFQQQCENAGIYCKDFNIDAFSEEAKKEVSTVISNDLGTIDLVIYSLAAPRRTDPSTGESYSSVLKPIGATYSSQTVDIMSSDISEVEITPASEQEIHDTVKVMGGEDWKLWIDHLKSEGLLSENALTIAYSYIGSSLTWPVYRDGTIGEAKKHLDKTAKELNESLAKTGGRALVSVNKALVTQASSAIPVVPLYLSLAYKVMKKHGVHEDCIQQMVRLFNERLNGRDFSDIPVDSAGRIRLDDWELREDIQEEIIALWGEIGSKPLSEVTDMEGVRQDYLKVFGFEYDEVDYSEPVDIAV